MQDRLNQATYLHQKGQLNEAESLYRELLNDETLNALVIPRLALLCHQTGRGHEALEFIKQGVQAGNKDIQFLKQGIHLATSLGENSVAEEWLKLALDVTPNDIEMNEQLAGVLIGNHREEEALELTKKVIRLAPKSASIYNIKGLALCRLGNVEKGYSCFQKAIKLNPGLLPAVRNLVLYGKGRKEPLLDQLIPQLENNYNNAKLPPQVKMNIAYVLAMYFEKKKEHAKTFRYLKSGNDISRTSYRYSTEDTKALFSKIKSGFSKEFITKFKEQCPGNGDAGPIFILGMPRSGTTLIEQILSSHSLVNAEGEILDMRESFDKHQSVLDNQIKIEDRISDCLLIGREYIESVRRRQPSDYFTDKMPYNFMMIGAIALSLPNAKIIHCTRDPLETCFSIYKQNFAGNHAYSNDLNELADYYHCYEDLMTYWKDLFGNKIYEANYETIVSDPERSIHQLLSFCDLQPEDACFAFYKNQRAVRTASVAQVRQPIYKDSVKATSPYKEYLNPLIERLENKVL